MSYRCELCRRERKEEEMVFLKLDFSSPAARFSVIPKSYMGVRDVCIHCVKEIQGLSSEDIELANLERRFFNLDQEIRTRLLVEFGFMPQPVASLPHTIERMAFLKVKELGKMKEFSEAVDEQK